MPGTMSQADLVADLKASMPGSDVVFSAPADADYIRQLDAAALDFSRVRPRTLVGAVTLSADISEYDAPGDLVRLKFPLWGINEKRARKPWESNYPGRLPRAYIVQGATGLQLSLEPAPNAAQIADLGSSYKFYYFAAHTIDTNATNTTILPADRGLLLLRAQAEAMKELAARNSHKPVKMRDGMNSTPRNGTPAALYEQLMDAFEAQVR